MRLKGNQSSDSEGQDVPSKKKSNEVEVAKVEISDNVVKFFVAKGLGKKRWIVVREIPVLEIEHIEELENKLNVTWKGATDTFFTKEKGDLFGELVGQVNSILEDQEKSKEKNVDDERAALRRNELLELINISVGIIDQSFNVLVSLQDKRINWERLEGFFDGFGENPGFMGQTVPPLKVDFSKVSSAAKSQVPKVVSNEVYSILKVVYGYFNGLSVEDEFGWNHPNFEDAKAAIYGYFTLNDLLLGRVVGEKENEEEISQLEGVLQHLAAETNFKVNIGELRGSINKIDVDGDRERVIERSREIFKQQLKQQLKPSEQALTAAQYSSKNAAIAKPVSENLVKSGVKCGVIEKKYAPEIPAKEMVELSSSIKAASQKIIAENIERMKTTDPHRPEAMKYFDEIANLFGQRQAEILAEKAKGKKIIGYTCLFAPTELILAAGAIPVRVNSGWYDAAKIGDRVVPVEVCPVIRSTIGAGMVELSPYLELSDALISVLTCDAMTKLSEILSDFKPVWEMNIPRVKDSDNALRLWNDEIRRMKTQIEEFTGNKITRKSLKAAIRGTQRATKAFRRLQDLRKSQPVIMGRDAMLVNQTYLWDDKARWTKKTEALCDELEKRAQRKDWVCPPETPRILITGTPMFWPDNWKVPTLVEEANPKGIIVADELCSGERILTDPVGIDEWTLDDMLYAIAERYLMASTCPCFTSSDGNEDRINWLLNKVTEWNVQGVIYYVVRGCMLYSMEYNRVKSALDKIHIPTYYLDTEYTREDTGQIKTRVEAFLEMLTTRAESGS